MLDPIPEDEAGIQAELADMDVLDIAVQMWDDQESSAGAHSDPEDVVREPSPTLPGQQPGPAESALAKADGDQAALDGYLARQLHEIEALTDDLSDLTIGEAIVNQWAKTYHADRERGVDQCLDEACDDDSDGW